MARLPNPGHLPPECEIRDEDGNVTGYRPVHVWLRCGWSSQAAAHAPWPSAGGRSSTRWSLRGDSHDILHFEVI